MNKLTAEKCREQFEKWLDKNSYNKNRDQMGLYEASFCQIAWIGWQASWQALEIALPVLEQQEKGEPVWIYWSGEVALPPVSNDVMVEVRMHSGNRMSGPAKTMRWRNYAPHPGDIVAYRVLEPQEMITDNQSVITDSAGMITDSAGLGDGWIEWKGGKQPIADSREVAIKFRDGTVMTETLSDCWVWSHGGDDDDIIAYRLVEQERERGKE